MTQTAESAMFQSDASDRRINELVADAAEDRDAIETVVDQLIAVLENLHRRDVTYADGGNGLDLIVLAKQFRPHSPEQVALKAREVAIELENL